MLKHYEIKDPLYQKDIVLSVGETEGELYEYLRKTYGPSFRMCNKSNVVDDQADLTNDGCQFNIEYSTDRRYHVWIQRKDLELLQHEIQHLAYDILDNVGLSLTDESEEAYTYYTSNLFMQAVRALWPTGTITV